MSHESTESGSTESDAVVDPRIADATVPAAEKGEVAGAASAGTGRRHPPGVKPPVLRRVPRRSAVPVLPEIVYEEQPRSWRHELVELVESWAGSLVFHAAVIAVLALWWVRTPERQVVQILDVIQRPQEVINQRLDELVDPSESITFATSASATSATHSDPLDVSSQPQLSQAVNRSINTPQVSLADVSLQSVAGPGLMEDLGMESPGEPAVAVEGYSGAFDRLTQEIVMMLSKGKVLVVWLFDQSESVVNDRQEVRDRIDRVYQELGLTSQDSDALLTAVASYAATVTIHTRKPTSRLEDIQAAMDEVPVDETGQENVCEAIRRVAAQFRRISVSGKFQLAVILVSDESGDDGMDVERTIAQARDSGCRIYVLGREAVFGYPYAHIVWKHEQTGFTYWIPINRGPETAFPEQLQTNGLWRRRDAHPSGFGPYEQVRLCRETGGIFFLLPSLEKNLYRGEKRIYELEAMRPYLPDLASRDDYLTKLNSSALASGIADIIRTLNPYEEPRVQLREYFDIQTEALANQIVEEQVKAHDLITVFEAAVEHLDRLATARRQEPSFRWQANYDLLYAQLLSYMVRVYEYGTYLEAFLENPRPPKIQNANRWRVHTRAKTISGEETREFIDRAVAMFQGIIAEHPGTPYAARAQWELNRGFGVEFREHHHPAGYDDVVRPKF